MNKEIYTILAIESSCDETAAAVVVDGQTVLSNVIASQIPIHQRYGGVVPEIAARAHVEQILPVIEKALLDAFGDGDTRALISDKIDAIAVTCGPGLVGSLLVGVNTARSLALAFDKPLIGVNHILGHLYANFIRGQGAWVSGQGVQECHSRVDGNPNLKLQVLSFRPHASEFSIHNSVFNPSFPFLTLVVSGGHSDLILSKSHTDHQLVGQTRDDAAGEAFDKAAQLLALSYPGGPSISKEAENGDPNKFDLPRAMFKLDTFDFSFSGLKTALKMLVNELQSDLSSRHSGNPVPHGTGASRIVDDRILDKTCLAGQARMTGVEKGQTLSEYIPDLCASFQEAVVDSLVDKTLKAARRYGVKQINLAGGVAANKRLREKLQQTAESNGFSFHTPDFQYCTDNAAMVGAAAYCSTLVKNDFPWYNVNVEREPELKL